MTQRQVTHPAGTLPRCTCDALPMHYHDGRRTSANGGHFLECAPCDLRTRRFHSLDAAILDFHRLIGTAPRAMRPDANVHAIARGGR